MENPYQPPESPVDERDEKPQELASHWARLGGALIDSILGIVVNLPVLYGLGFFNYLSMGQEPPYRLTVFASILGVVLFMALHGYLLKSAGQTIGKKLIGIRIVSLEGQILSLPDVLLKRYGPVWVVSMIPLVGGLLSLIDVLFIFGEDKRCVHDYIAGTKVVNV